MTQLPPVFIVGCPRSGTTALAVHLDRHPLLAVPPETHFFTEVGRGGDRRLTGLALARHLLAHERLADLPVDESELDLEPAATAPEVFLGLMRAHSRKSGARGWCEKTPNHLLVAHRIRRRLADARFVCIVRDGRDVALSLQRVNWASNDLARNALFWCRTAQRVLELERAWPPDVFLRVHFEDLVREPRETLGRVCDFLGIAFEEAMLDTQVAVETIPDWEHEWKEKARTPLDPSRIGAWRNETGDRERWLMNGIQQRYLEALGYGGCDLSACPREVRLRFLMPRFKNRARAIWRAMIRRTGPVVGWDFA